MFLISELLSDEYRLSHYNNVRVFASDFFPQLISVAPSNTPLHARVVTDQMSCRSDITIVDLKKYSNVYDLRCFLSKLKDDDRHHGHLREPSRHLAR
jgi:hypothetical protein